jgi:endonuclease/exonuclease/phosphatase family metal-dependent hydrolase
MKIATWNIERPIRTAGRIKRIIECLKEVDADILILTETNTAVHFGDVYTYHHSEILQESFYKDGERRTSIYCKYSLIESYATFRADTSICKKLKTPFGDLVVYGTVIGINGNRRKNFDADLNEQLKDFKRISVNANFCIAGDLNMTFGDNYYFTQDGRQKLNDSFEKLQLVNLTAGIPENIDHIILSNAFINGKTIKLTEWNLDKKLSDHIGVCVEITEI